MISLVKETFKNTTFRALYLLNVQKALRKIKQRDNKTTVLCFHRVSADYDYFWDPMKPDNFEQLIRYLLKYYDIISIEEINSKSGGRPKAILSFDDGYYDFYTNVLPVLKHYSLPANHNVVTDIVSGRQDVIWTEKLNYLFKHFKDSGIGDGLQLNGVEYSAKEQGSLDRFYITVLRQLFMLSQAERQVALDNWLSRYKLLITPKRMMGWKEIVECDASGVSFGSHTKTHPVLTSITNEDEMNKELVESKLEIERNLGKKIWAIAPPNGMCNDAVMQQIAMAGYKFILGIGNLSEVQKIKGDLTFFSRINLISEPFANMILRTEELQSNLKKYGGL